MADPIIELQELLNRAAGPGKIGPDSPLETRLYGANGQPIGTQTNPLDVRVRELEAKLDELKQTIESGVQLKGRNVDDGKPVSALSVVLDNDGHPVLRVVDVAPPALDETLDRWRVVFDPPPRSEIVIVDSEIRHTSARTVHLAQVTDIARCRDFDIIITNSLRNADGQPCTVSMSFYRTEDGTGGTHVLTEEGTTLLYYPGTTSICHSIAEAKNIPLSSLPARTGNGVTNALNPHPYKALGHNISLLYQVFGGTPVEGRLKFVFVGVPN